MRSWICHYRDKIRRTPCISSDNAILNKKRKNKVFYVNLPLIICSTIQNIVRVRLHVLILRKNGIYSSVRYLLKEGKSSILQLGSFRKRCLLRLESYLTVLNLRKRLFSIRQCPEIIDNDETVQSAVITPL